MKNLEICKRIHIKVWFTAADWQLYDLPYANAVAARLNSTLAEYVNRGETRETTKTFVLRHMAHEREHGATDTEPLAFLERVLDKIYGVDHG